MRIVKLTPESRADILNSLLKRSPNHYTEYESAVKEILENVRTRRDEALFAYTLQFENLIL